MSEVILYTIGCPKCDVLEKKLDAAGIKYDKVCDKSAIIAKGFKVAPVLEADGKTMMFAEAVKWLSAQSADQK